MEIPEREEIEKGTELISKSLIYENFPKLMSNTKT